MSNTTILDLYQDIVRKHKKDYGERTICFCQVGSFYELYDDGSNLINIKEIGDILQIQVTRKNKAIQEVSRSNHLMCGFPDYTLNKFLNMMVNHNYTIVVVSQVTPPPHPKRAITQIVSPGTYIESIDTYESTNMMSIYIDEITEGKEVIVGVSVIDISTGQSRSVEYSSRERDFTYPFDEVYRLILSHNPKELVLCGNSRTYTYRDICDRFDISKKYVHNRLNDFDDSISTISYQTAFLAKVFPNHGLLSPIEYINLERHATALVSFVALIQFVYKHSESILKHIQPPEYIHTSNTLDLSYNATSQLQLQSVCNILNTCTSAVGKRYFKDRLFNPLADAAAITERYDQIESLIVDDSCLKCSKYLEDVYDIERLFRKIQINTIQPSEWCHIVSSCDALDKATSLASTYYRKLPTFDISKTISEFRAYITTHLDTDCIYKYNVDNIDSSFFCKGIYPEIDVLDAKLIKCKEYFADLLSFLNSTNEGHFRLESNDKDGYYFMVTAKRFKEYQAKVGTKTYTNGSSSSTLKLSELTGKPLSSSSTVVRVTHSQFTKINEEIDETKRNLKELICKQYTIFMNECCVAFYDHMNIMKETLKTLDYSCANAKNAIKFRYSRPHLSPTGTNKSFLEIKKLRHPLVERINTSLQYTTNDISLGLGQGKESADGMLLFGINSAGKSTLMKSVGIAVIMAQAGMYVPASHMEFALYSTIFTRIPSGDDITRGQSTFTVEILELRNILKRANSNSLVIGDELCSGTESISAMSIVSAGIIDLCKRKSSFIFASHLHDLVNIPQVTNLKNLQIMHLEVRYDEQSKKLIYDRLLKSGPGTTLYGLEVCRALDLDPQFLITANEIRHNLLGTDSNIISNKKSRYNASKFIDTCGICGKKSSDVHHINEQYTSDNRGFIDYFHKNSLFNLVCICESCHTQVHTNKINVTGYVQTSKGVELEWNVTKDEAEDAVEAETETKGEVLKQTVRKLRLDGISIKKISDQLSITPYMINKILKTP